MIARSLIMYGFLPLISLIASTLSLTTQVWAQDTEVTNYKSGISLTYSGTRGTSFAEEYLFHDKLISDRKVIYIKSDTLLSLRHNERNVARITGSTYHLIGENGLDGIPNNGDEGTIRYKVDGDLSYGRVWSAGAQASQGGTPNPAYSSPLSFASLTYPDGLNVLGKTGDNGKPYVPKLEYFSYGLNDLVGDEWHTIQVADDDWDITATDSEWRASDGKVLLFVVNPKTPALTWRATGTGQFYTTPAKSYFIPKIHEQTTYFSAGGSGSVSLEITDINGNNVFYRIISNANPNPPFINAGSKTASLTQDNFPLGYSTLEYYYLGREAFKKKRVIVKDPNWPSAGESHGYLLAGSPNNYAAMLLRTKKPPYAYFWNRLLSGADGGRGEWDQIYGKGLRIVPSNAAVNALVAKVQGISAHQTNQSKSYALYAKQMLLENSRNIDSVGTEYSHSQTTLPSREINYRGYYDVGTIFDMALAYDLLISIFRSDQDPNGITAIEDYFIRDSLAQFVLESLGQSAGIQTSFTAINTGGMWDTARKVAAVVAMIGMPKYSTPYYGTSGMDGNQNTFPYTPFITAPLTWKAAFLDKTTPLLGYPNLSNRLGVEEYNCMPDGNFLDKVDYVGHMGRSFYMLGNVLKYHYPQYSTPNMEAFFLKATTGQIRGVKNNSGPSRYIFLPMFNAQFPIIANEGVPFVQSFPATDNNSDEKSINGVFLASLAWYDVDYVVNAPVTAPRSPSNLRVMP